MQNRLISQANQEITLTQLDNCVLITSTSVTAIILFQLAVIWWKHLHRPRGLLILQQRELPLARNPIWFCLLLLAPLLLTAIREIPVLRMLYYLDPIKLQQGILWYSKNVIHLYHTDWLEKCWTYLQQ